MDDRAASITHGDDRTAQVPSVTGAADRPAVSAGRDAPGHPGPAPRPAAEAEARDACRILITAGPTHEPIDAVRYVGNRSSGRMGIALATAAYTQGHHCTLLLGPTDIAVDSPVALRRFRTAADLAALLGEEFHRHDILIMAAAVADYRPTRLLPGRPGEADLSHGTPGRPVPASEGKIRRMDGPLTLVLDPVPDLLAAAAARRRPDQTVVGFALESVATAEDLVRLAREKLARKSIDAIVANPLETMQSATIDGVLVHADGTVDRPPRAPTSKDDFAVWLIRVLTTRWSTGTARPASA